uniref:hypothetical protein n=1 Tax=Cupriavidus yeoncheonensis TaxID=1462994 RepID=UPI003F49A8EE
MHTVIRAYSGMGTKDLFALLEKRTADVESLMRSVDGFVSYTLARSEDGDFGFSVTVCNDKAGVEESSRKAKEWIMQNAAGIVASAPTLSEGVVILHAK